MPKAQIRQKKPGTSFDLTRDSLIDIKLFQ